METMAGSIQCYVVLAYARVQAAKQANGSFFCPQKSSRSNNGSFVLLFSLCDRLNSEPRLLSALGFWVFLGLDPDPP